jgi:heptosyltransferase-2
VDAENQARLTTRFELGGNGPVVALAPGAAFGPSKRWPEEHFRSLARHLAQQGRTVVVMGGADEEALGEEIARSAGPSGRNLCGRTALTDALDILALAEVAVANDSGLAHMAGAVETPAVVLFGPTTPRFAAPLAARSDNLYLGLDCSPCFKRTCPLGHHRCLRDITVDEVIDRIDELAV